MRGPRIKAVAKQNYRLFYEGFCRRKVPIVMVVTGLEVKEDMNGWWDENRRQFDAYHMHFGDVACITATRGKLKDGKHAYQMEYEQSRRKVEDLIRNHYSKTPWRMSIRALFFSVAFKMREVYTSTLGFEQDTFAQELGRALQSHKELSLGEATAASLMKRLDGQAPPPNVIVFGATGVGKSSILNMLEGDGRAQVADGAGGVTSESTCYERKIGGKTFKIYDTIGLDEGAAGTIPAKTAIANLYQLIHKLSDGVNLLVYVMRASRITETTRNNYHMYYDIFWDRKVPIVVIVTGLENRDPMSDWWRDNEAAFRRLNMTFSGHACVTATEGKPRNREVSYSSEYEESKVEVESLILHSFSVDPWKLPAAPWFASVAIGLYNVFAHLFGFNPKAYARKLSKALKECGGLSTDEAVKEAKKIQTGLKDHKL